jgi:diacylglycerol kinase (ATP)
MSGFSLGERMKSFVDAGRGLILVLRMEHNAWIHAMMTTLAVVLGLLFRISSLEWCAVVAVVGLVWAAEALNTAVESLADAAIPEQHPKVRDAKDAAAGAVLACAIAAAIVGLIVFGPRLWAALV